MKNLLKVGIVLLTVVLVSTYAYAAIESKVELKAEKNEVSKNEEFTVEVELSDIEAEKGIITFGATLEYDDANFEFVKIEGKNDWANPSYNEENGKFVMDRNEPTTDGETIAEITLKSKDTAKKDLEITLKEISVADGDEKAELEDTTSKITIKGDSKKEDKTTSENTTKGNTTPISTTTNTNITRNTNTTGNVTRNTTTNTTATTAETDIPKAGDTNIVTMVFVVATAALCVLYFGKLNEIKKKEHDMNIEK